jgi:putative methionine-R-sulfoxide reductase with GAF domain
MSQVQIAHQLLAIAQLDVPRRERAQQIVAAIQGAGAYHWVGMFTVNDDGLDLLAHTGNEAPLTTRLRLGEGLNGAAALTRESVVVNDVAQDWRYRPTYVTTRSEVAVPVTDPMSDRVVATLCIESDQVQAFGATEVVTLEVCGWAIAPLWG